MSNGKTLYILLLNMMIPGTLRFIVMNVEKQHSVNAESRNLFLRIFFLTFFNTAVVLLLENFNFNPSHLGENNYYLFNMIPIPKGKYSDFTAKVFREIGATFTYTMLLQIFTSKLRYVTPILIKFVLRLWDQSNLNF